MNEKWHQEHVLPRRASAQAGAARNGSLLRGGAAVPLQIGMVVPGGTALVVQRDEAPRAVRQRLPLPELCR